MAQHAAQQQAYGNQTATAGGLGSLFTVTSATGTNTWVTPLTTSTPTLVTQAVSSALYISQGTAGALWAGDSALVRDTLRLMGDCMIEDGVPCNVHLPDGSVLMVGSDGSFTINDKDAKVTYRANRLRDFNPFINASDKLEGFIKLCGALGVKQDEMMQMPVKLFIGWLIIEAARADGEQPDVNLLDGIHDHVRPRCTCGRFIARERIRKKVFFCRPECMERRLAA